MNIWKMTASVVAMLSMLAVPSTASAAPLDPAHVSADAKWVIHVDLDALADTALAEQVRQKRPEMVKHVRQWFQDRYGIDPREDLDALTIFSDTYESHTGTMILKAGYDRDKVKAELENKQGVQTESWQELTLYTLTKQKRGKHLDDSNQQEGSDRQERGDQRQNRAHKKYDRSITIVLLDDDTAIFASSADRAKAAVKLLQGDSPSLEGKDSELLKELAEGAVVYGAAVDLKQIAQREGVFPILRQHERIYWSVGEDDGETFRKLTLVAESEEVAGQVKTALEGLVAFAKLWAADSENLTRIVEDAEITVEGKVVEFQGRSDTETVINALGDLRERVRQRFGAAGN